MPTLHKVKGFTLMEMLIVIAIMGLLLVIVLPTYRAHTLKTNRSDAFAALNEIMQAQERHAADTGSYTTDLTQMGYASAGNVASERGLYRISATTCSGGAVIAQCVNLSAAAQGPQAEDLNNGSGTGNIPITLNSRGEKQGWGN